MILTYLLTLFYLYYRSSRLEVCPYIMFILWFSIKCLSQNLSECCPFKPRYGIFITECAQELRAVQGEQKYLLPKHQKIKI